jgi:hypothetical protein
VDAGSDCKFDIDGPSRFSHPKRMVPIVVDRTLNYSQVKVTAASESRGRGWNSGRPDRVESQCKLVYPRKFKRLSAHVYGRSVN